MLDREPIGSRLVFFLWVFGLGAWMSLSYFWWTAVNTPNHVTDVRWNEFNEFWLEGVLIHGTIIFWIGMITYQLVRTSKR